LEALIFTIHFHSTYSSQAKERFFQKNAIIHRRAEATGAQRVGLRNMKHVARPPRKAPRRFLRQAVQENRLNIGEFPYTRTFTSLTVRVENLWTILATLAVLK
jgi:hypothetical protein